VSGLHHVELRPRSLRYYTTERPQRLCRKQTQRRHSRAKYPVLSAACPLYPRKRTCAVQLGMSALGQQRTSRPGYFTGGALLCEYRRCAATSQSSSVTSSAPR